MKDEGTAMNYRCETDRAVMADLLRLSSSRAAGHIGQQRVVASVTGRQQQLHIPPM